jgi:hypothetical protein
VEVSDNQSLADGDIVVIKPTISPLYDVVVDYYQGKPSLNEGNSFELKDILQHWQREIISTLAAGKTLFVFLTDIEEAFVDTGERKYSGTGRNRQTTRIVSKVSNYDLLPFPVSIVNSCGKSIRLAPKADILAEFWSLFGSNCQYRVLVEGKVTQPLLLSRDAHHVVGAIVRVNDSPGHVVLLPLPEIDEESMTEITEEGEFWNEAGMAFGGRLTTALVSIDKQLRAEGQATPPPVWASSGEYDLPVETELSTKLLRLQEKVQDLNQSAKALQLQISKEGALKRLLYATGLELEEAIHDALISLGFKTHHFRDSESEFDAVFESVEGRFIGEAEGKDNRSINIDKLRQLEMNIHEDLQRDEVSEPAKGVLFGNAYRLSPPEERGAYFTDKCMSAARRTGIALVRTPDLFVAVKTLKIKPHKHFAAACRAAMFAATGQIVRFPSLPEEPQKKKTRVTIKKS